ncbi:MAG: HAMP domain-containing sensor histidine kinase [Kiritimatiellae bacterium]|nr:HAMP domain-containing sensor histidine kinase [Kiritimatiellia bacterium]MDD4025537.1 HAMP domain-containing sensor histidine kinase [Kiritimatiellia bacterium]MDD4621604.1 HAMP domain-containing sensor histidine kinase [Kiritimatiellia bacterium]
MSSTAKTEKAYPFFAFLSLSYLVVYAVCACVLYLVNSHVLSESAREFDREDIQSDSLEYREILHNNVSGNWLAEEVSIENHPASTLFAIRVLGPDGHVVYAASQPKDLAFPGGWGSRQPRTGRPIPKDGWREIYLPAYKRYLQLKSTLLPDGRVLQVAKSTIREHDLEGHLIRTSLVFFLLATLLTLGNGFWLLVITMRPIQRLNADMSNILSSETGDHETVRVRSRIAEIDALGCFFDRVVRKNAALVAAMRDTLDNVAHDFRTPLTRIRSAAEHALRARQPPATRETLLSTLGDIIEDCDTARLQLQNLLDVRAMESGLVKLDLQHLDLKVIVSEVADLYAVMAEDKGIDLQTALPDGEVFIDGDHGQLSQAIANLIDNAVKYTPRDGSVIVTLEDAQGDIRLIVADSGIGIPEDEHALIWQRLYRSRNARTEKGLGLGMSIVKAIIDAHGGTISFASTLGKGTTFTVTFPAGSSETR